MESINEQLTQRIDRYIERLFNPQDEALAQGLQAAAAAGLPTINVSANEGKLLYLIARIAQARRVLEIGTLGGYSTTWLARALPPDGRLVTLELEQKHAHVARQNLERSGLGQQVEIRVGRALDSLQVMIDQGETPFDLIFIDADKESYVAYLNLALQLAHSGSVILADNLIRNGRVLEDSPAEASARGAKAYNETIAGQPQLDSIILPIIRENLDGLSISIVR